MRLTLAGKVVLFVVITGIAAAVLYGNKDEWFASSGRQEAGSGESLSSEDFAGIADGSAAPAEASGDKEAKEGPLGTGKLDRPLRVAINTWVGHAGAILANGGLETQANSIFAKAGLKVELVKIEDPAQKQASLISGSVDIMWDTVDTWASEAPQIADRAKMHPRAILLQDWSRGGDGIVSAMNINSIEDLKGKKVALAKFTPSHFLLLYLLVNSNLSSEDRADIGRNLVYTDDAAKAANLFVAGQVDAAVTWEPDLTIAAEKGNGRKLATTETVSNLIADVMVARPEVINKAPETITAFVKGYLEALSMLDTQKQAAHRILADALALPTEEIEGMLSGVKLTNYGDNAAFFGLNNKPKQFDALFSAASKIWRREGVITSVVEAHNARDSRFIAALQANFPETNAGDNFDFSEPAPADAEPLLSKTATIHFATASSTLAPDSKYVLNDFGETLQSLGNAYVRIEGNTDNVGSRQANIALSKKRAEAVKQFFVQEYGFNAQRFIVIGNGPEKPVADNDTEEGRQKNRRTEFMIIAKQ